MKKLLILSIGLFIFYLGFVNFTDLNEVGIAYNRFNGDLWLQDTGGWKFNPPWVLVARVDTRPVRVCVTSAGRGFNCKLVQFQPKAYQIFVETEGFRYYWWANRFSFNSGYTEEYRGMKDLLRGYAFSAKKYPFLRVIGEYTAQP